MNIKTIAHKTSKTIAQFMNTAHAALSADGPDANIVIASIMRHIELADDLRGASVEATGFAEHYAQGTDARRALTRLAAVLEDEGKIAARERVEQWGQLARDIFRSGAAHESEQHGLESGNIGSAIVLAFPTHPAACNAIREMEGEAKRMPISGDFIAKRTADMTNTSVPRAERTIWSRVAA